MTLNELKLGLFLVTYTASSHSVITAKASTLKSLSIQVTLSPFPKRQILDSSKLKEFADDNFKFDENSREFS